MNHYISSFWSGARSGWGSRVFRIGGGPSGGGCRCTRQCTCVSGGPCRCSSGCSCSGASPRRSSLWIESGEADEFRRRPVPRFARRPTPMRRHAPVRQYAQTRRYAPSRRYYSAGQARYYRPPGHAPRWNTQQRWWPRQRWNAILSNRHGWNRFSGRIGSFFGCPGCTPGSQRFSSALASWQYRHGLRPSGVLTPGLWRWLRPRIGQPRWQQPGAGAADAPAPMPAPPMPPPPAAPQAEPPEGAQPSPDPAAAAPEPAPDAGPPPDATPDAPPDADGTPPAGDSEYGWGFRRRRQVPAQRQWQPYYSIY